VCSRDSQKSALCSFSYIANFVASLLLRISRIRQSKVESVLKNSQKSALYILHILIVWWKRLSEFYDCVLEESALAGVQKVRSGEILKR